MNRVEWINSIEKVPAEDWNGLIGEYPFLRHEFLRALETEGCANAKSGWQPLHVLVYDNDQLVAVMPQYLKGHSQGEYVFDYEWAYAYERHGLQYYPKLLTAAPFSPVTGPRWGVKPPYTDADFARVMYQALVEQSEQLQLSSWHCLFPENSAARILETLPVEKRVGYQFHWFNKGYDSFDHYLQQFTSKKRKNVKRERRLVRDQGISVQRVEGRDITAEQWQQFFEFYQATYYKRGMQPYLSLECFQRLGDTMADSLLLIDARKADAAVGMALLFKDSHTLYGRYWGCFEEYDSLHFEACYYQGLEYCIEQGLQRFDPGTQGEHKIARGFEPIETVSYHWIADSRFRSAIADFVRREANYIDDYRAAVESALPFKHEP